MSFPVKFQRLCNALNRFDILAPGFKPIKAYTNWLRANYEMMRRVSRVSAKPLKLNVEPTNSCQLRCPLCPTGLNIMPRARSNIRFDLYKKLISEVGDYVFFIDFHNWGEPLLNKQLEDFILLARAKNISTAISTNFSLRITDERLRNLILSGLNHMIVSLDGASKETVTTYRKGMNFELVVNNMRRLTAIKKEMRSRTPYISWQFLVFRFNEHELDKAQRMARDIGVDRLMFSHASLDTDAYPLSKEDKETIKAWVPTDPILTSYTLQDSGYVRQNRPKRCDWLYLSSALNSDGALSPCCAVYKEEDAFSSPDFLENHSYMDIYNNSTFQRIRDKFAGRISPPLGITCEQCSNSDLMRYGEGVNRIIILGTAAKLVYGIMRPVCEFFNRQKGGKKPEGAGTRTVIQWPC